MHHNLYFRICLRCSCSALSPWVEGKALLGSSDLSRLTCPCLNCDSLLNLAWYWSNTSASLLHIIQQWAYTRTYCKSNCSSWWVVTVQVKTRDLLHRLQLFFRAQSLTFNSLNSLFAFRNPFKVRLVVCCLSLSVFVCCERRMLGFGYWQDAWQPSKRFQFGHICHCSESST